MIENLGINNEKLKLVSSSTVYEYNNDDMFVEKIPRMTPTSKHIALKYHWFRQTTGKKFMIQKIESENLKSDICTKGLQGEFFFQY